MPQGYIETGGVGGFVPPPSGSLNSGMMASGFIFFLTEGATLLSGQVSSGFIGNAAVVSGSIGSGQISQFHIASGQVTSGRIGTAGTPDGTKFLRDDFTWASVGAASLASGDVGSGKIASGAIQGFFGATRHIASGTVGVFDLGSGAVVAGSVGSGAVVSGNIASGSVGRFHIGSGQLAGFELGSGAVVSGRIASGQVGDGHLADGSVTSGKIASGQVDWPHLSSGAVRSGHLSANSVVSGNIASGILNSFNFSSGTVVPATRYVAPFNSGTPLNIITEEEVSGVRAVHLTLSGTLRIAMASVAARMPAIGVVVDDVVSGFKANVWTVGFFQHHVNTTDYSGYLGKQVYVGRSGQVVQADGSFNSGGLLSGDVLQPIGYAVNSGGTLLEVAPPHVSGSALGSGAVLSGTIASGQVGPNHIASGAVQSGRIGSGSVEGFFGTTRHVASGTVGVFDLGSGAVVAGTVGSGSIVSGNVASGQLGRFHIASGQLAGFELGSGAIVSGRIASGQVGNFHIASGAVTSGRIGAAGTPDGSLFLRDDFTWATAGAGLSSGAVGSGYVASGAIQGFFGVTRHVASGTIGVFDFGSGAVTAGTVGSGAVVSGNVASGQLGTYHHASGAVVDRSQYVLPIVSGVARIGAVITEEIVSGVKAVHLTKSGTLRVAMASISGRMPAIGIVADNVASGIQAQVFAFGSLQFTSGMADFSGYLGETLYVGRSGQIVTASGSFNSGGLLSGDVWQPIGSPVNSGAATLEVASQLAFLVGEITSGNIASGQVARFHLASGAVNSGHIGDGGVVGRGVGGINIASGSVSDFDIAGAGVLSGHIASGQVHTYHHSSGSQAATAATVSPLYSGTLRTMLVGEPVSGTRAVCFGSGGWLRIAMASVSGRMPAVGVVWDNVTSGRQANVHTVGFHQFTSGMADYSGYVPGRVFVGRSGQVTTISGSWSSAGFASGDLGQVIGSIGNSGGALLNVFAFLWSGGPLGFPYGIGVVE